MASSFIRPWLTSMEAHLWLFIQFFRTVFLSLLGITKKNFQQQFANRLFSPPCRQMLHRLWFSLHDKILSSSPVYVENAMTRLAADRTQKNEETGILREIAERRNVKITPTRLFRLEKNLAVGPLRILENLSCCRLINLFSICRQSCLPVY